MKKIILLLLLATTANAQRIETPEARLDRIELHVNRYAVKHERGGMLFLFGAAATGLAYVVSAPKDRPYVMATGAGFMLWGSCTVYLAGREFGKIKRK